MRALFVVLVVAWLSACEESPTQWCRAHYYFPPIPDSLATDSIPWWDPDAPVVEPDSVVLEYC